MQVIKYPLKPGLNVFSGPGTLKLVHMDWQYNKLQGWFIETPKDYHNEYKVYISVTGEQVPLEYDYVGSTQTHTGSEYFVVHAFD